MKPEIGKMYQNRDTDEIGNVVNVYTPKNCKFWRVQVRYPNSRQRFDVDIPEEHWDWEQVEFADAVSSCVSKGKVIAVGGGAPNNLPYDVTTHCGPHGILNCHECRLVAEGNRKHKPTSPDINGECSICGEPVNDDSVHEG